MACIGHSPRVMSGKPISTSDMLRAPNETAAHLCSPDVMSDETNRPQHAAVQMKVALGHLARGADLLADGR